MEHLWLQRLLPFEAEGVQRYQWIIWLCFERTDSGFEIILENVALGVRQVLLIDIWTSIKKASSISCVSFKVPVTANLHFDL